MRDKGREQSPMLYTAPVYYGDALSESRALRSGIFFFKI
jgi:hypothetical protein